MTRAIYPASFDPITFGHINIATRAAHLFDELIIAVFDKPHKKLLFSPDERFEMTQKAVKQLKNVSVQRYRGLTVHFAQNIEATVIVRGLRTVADFEWEMQLSQANNKLAAEIDTLCLMTDQKFSFISSSIVKEIALNDGQVAHLVPDHVAKALQKKAEARG